MICVDSGAGKRYLSDMRRFQQRLLATTACFFLLCSSCSQRSLDEKRERMISQQFKWQGITDERVIAAFREVPRELFVLPEHRDKAYDDIEAPLGEGQTLDRPYEDALIITELNLRPTDRVLEVGTGAGYLAALIAKLAAEVYTIEIRETLANRAAERVASLGYRNIFVRAGDGYKGWPEKAPFDAIVLTASPDRVPEPLIQQLREGGRLVLPLGSEKKFQELLLYTKQRGEFVLTKRIQGTEFVPMEGIIQKKPER